MFDPAPEGMLNKRGRYDSNEEVCFCERDKDSSESSVPAAVRIADTLNSEFMAYRQQETSRMNPGTTREPAVLGLVLVTTADGL